MESRVTVEVLVLRFAATVSPGVVKKLSHLNLWSYVAAVRIWASRFHFDMPTDVAMLSHMF